MATKSGVSSANDDQPIPAADEISSDRDCSAMSTNCQTKDTTIPPPLYSLIDNMSELTNPEKCDYLQSPVPSYEEISFEPKTKSPENTETSLLLPSYSSIMKNPSNDERCVDRFHSSIAPPTYNDVPGVFVIPSSRQTERMYTIQNLPETMWSSHSQPAYCPRCDFLVLTMTQTHESLATHVSALALCLFGCWPCCLLPYCLNICKNTYHICPICKQYLGANIPW